MGLLGEWRASRDRRHQADRYVREVLGASDPAEADWLAAAVGDRARATRELHLARRALALIVAERDALDDRTASEVAHSLAALIDRESRPGDNEAASQWSARWKAYSAALAVRGQVESPVGRLARVLLTGAGLEQPSHEQLQQATQFMLTNRARANEALRAVFGVASLPDDVRPSAIRP